MRGTTVQQFATRYCDNALDSYYERQDNATIIGTVMRQYATQYCDSARLDSGTMRDIV